MMKKSVSLGGQQKHRLLKAQANAAPRAK